VTVEPDVVVRPANGETAAVALLLPGGTKQSFDPAEVRQLAAVRMVPFARSLAQAGAARGLAVWTLRYRFRGWNGEQMSPVADTRWALDEVRRRHGEVPVVLVGHSMGGRTAVRAADDASVRAIVALAPWLPDGEPVDQLRDRSVLIVHGNSDTVTSPRAARRYAREAENVAARLGFVSVRGDMHAMLFRWRAWHRLTTGFTLGALGMRAMHPTLQRALDSRADGIAV
jgi:alpha-beta hydrolase superfamily lysophospholipase